MKKNNSPLISVIMSVYNGERYIARAVLSVLVQMYADFELILIDDGSTDNTADIVSHINDKRLRFYSQKNMGLTKTLNRALTLANGRWIARHDADDFSILTRFANQMDFLDKNPSVGLLGSSCFIQPERHGIINEIYDYPECHDEIVAAFSEYNPFVHGSMVIKRDIIEACGGYNENYRYVQDYELWSRLLHKTKSHNLVAPLYVRSVHQSASQVSIKKEPIFNEIRDNYLKKVITGEHNDSFRQIRGISLYPVLTRSQNWNRSISNSLFRMSGEAKRQNLPWKSLCLQSFFYCPWHFL